MSKQKIDDQGGLIVLHPVQIADEDTYNMAMDIIEADPDTRAPKAFEKVNTQTPDNFIMEPVHSDEDPIVVDASHMALLWRDKDDPENHDLMVAILLELVKREDSTYRKAPCGIITGDEFQGILQYRCPCCGDNDTGFSMMFFVMDEDEKIGFTTRDSETTKQSKERLFESVPQGVTVSSHQIKHILHHHKNFGVACGHDHAVLPQRVEVQKLGL